MLALMIPLVGMPFFEDIPEQFRGSFFERVHRVNYEDVHVDSFNPSFTKMTFRWNSQYARGNCVRRRIEEPAPLDVIFDIFEEIES